MSAAERYQELVNLLKRKALLNSCNSVLSWERETYMPDGGADLRSEQVSLLAGLHHQWATSPRLGEVLQSLAEEDWGGPQTPAAINIRQAAREYTLATKLPQKLVEEISRVTALSQHAWHVARKKNDFASFLPWLKQVIVLKQEQARCLRGDADGPLYDALLDQYEPGMTTAQVQATFGPLREQLVPLVAAIADSAVRPEEAILQRNYPIEAQREFSRTAAAAIGFDFQRGRIDESAHPFCSGFGPGDCRLTTRYDPHFFNMAFFGTLHEAGHGIYEQGLDPAAFGLGMGDAVSLGIHESQSRMWENLVGRSAAFWQHFYPQATKMFPEALANVSPDQFYAAINLVQPSLIRVEADEVTYNLHIMLRFELEQQLISGELQPDDLPAAWNNRFEEYLGIVPPDDAHGCMQDVHWSAGLIGYFPTYALGNMYASQFFLSAEQALGDLASQFAAGEFLPLKEWLNTHIHQPGQKYLAAELVEHVTGSPLSAEPMLNYLKQKFGALYQLG